LIADPGQKLGQMESDARSWPTVDPRAWKPTACPLRRPTTRLGRSKRRLGRLRRCHTLHVGQGPNAPRLPGEPERLPTYYSRTGRARKARLGGAVGKMSKMGKVVSCEGGPLFLQNVFQDPISRRHAEQRHALGQVFKRPGPGSRAVAPAPQKRHLAPHFMRLHGRISRSRKAGLDRSRAGFAEHATCIRRSFPHLWHMCAEGTSHGWPDRPVLGQISGLSHRRMAQRRKQSCRRHQTGGHGGLPRLPILTLWRSSGHSQVNLAL